MLTIGDIILTKTSYAKQYLEKTKGKMAGNDRRGFGGNRGDVDL